MSIWFSLVNSCTYHVPRYKEWQPLTLSLCLSQPYPSLFRAYYLHYLMSTSVVILDYKPICIDVSRCGVLWPFIYTCVLKIRVYIKVGDSRCKYTFVTLVIVPCTGCGSRTNDYGKTLFSFFLPTVRPISICYMLSSDHFIVSFMCVWECNHPDIVSLFGWLSRG